MYSTFKALMCTTVQPTVSILDEGVLAKLSNSGPASIAHSRADAIPIPVFGRKKIAAGAAADPARSYQGCNQENNYQMFCWLMGPGWCACLFLD